MKDAACSRKRLALQYALGLGLVAALATASYFVFQRLIASQDLDAMRINISGQQRMLSQRILSAALQYAQSQNDAESAEAAKRLREAVSRMKANRDHLFRGKDGLPPLISNGLHPGAHESLRAFHSHLDAFIQTAEALAEAPPSSEHVRKHLNLLLGAGNDVLLDRLDAVVTQLQAEHEHRVSVLSLLSLIVLAATLLLLLAEAAFIFHPMVDAVCRNHKALTEVNSLLEHAATTDKLTGALNRRKFQEVMSREWLLARRYGSPLSLLFFDIDHFKKVNDDHGHQVGDLVLTELSGLVQGHVRRSDYLFRWGGEEFAVLAPHTALEAASVMAEHLRLLAQGRAFAGSLSVTVSFGVASLGAGETADDLIRRADSALYEAKRSGRNQVVAR